jgi:hypothetical protein
VVFLDDGDDIVVQCIGFGGSTHLAHQY